MYNSRGNDFSPKAWSINKSKELKYNKQNKNINYKIYINVQSPQMFNIYTS